MCDDLQSNCFGSCDFKSSTWQPWQSESHVGDCDQALAVYRNDGEKAPPTPCVVSSSYKTSKTLGDAWLVVPEAAVGLKRRPPLSVRGWKFSGWFFWFSSKSVVSHSLLPEVFGTRSCFLDLHMHTGYKCDCGLLWVCLRLHSWVNNKQPTYWCDSDRLSGRSEALITTAGHTGAQEHYLPLTSTFLITLLSNCWHNVCFQFLCILYLRHRSLPYKIKHILTFFTKSTWVLTT